MNKNQQKYNKKRYVLTTRIGDKDIINKVIDYCNTNNTTSNSFFACNNCSKKDFMRLRLEDSKKSIIIAGFCKRSCFEKWWLN